MLEQILAIDDALGEADILLHAVAAGATNPGVRELLVRHRSLSRVVKGWGAAPPHEAQVAAMLECVTELLVGVKRVCALTAPPASAGSFQRFQTARPAAWERKTSPTPPTVGSLDPRLRSTRPPPRRRSSPIPLPPPSQPPPSSR